MILVYNEALDLYHTIYRFLSILNSIPERSVIEVDRLRIWDFYLLFPSKLHFVRIKRNEDIIRKARNIYIKKNSNPYMDIGDEKKVFEKLRTYHMSALHCIASYGIIDKETLSQGVILVVNKGILTQYSNTLSIQSSTEKDTISFLYKHMYSITLNGPEGLKNRTGLIESKYDAQ